MESPQTPPLSRFRRPEAADAAAGAGPQPASPWKDPDRTDDRAEASGPGPVELASALGAGAGAALAAAARASLRRVLIGPRLPSWSWRTELRVDAQRAFLDLAVRRDPAILQRGLDRSPPGGSPSAPLVERHSLRDGPVRGEWIRPVDGRGDGGPVLLYLHGGGYVTGSPASHRELVSRLALAARARAFSLDYRLAPRHPFPAALEDAATAYRFLLDAGEAPERIAVGGDSAGGGLTLALLQEIRRQGWPRPACALALCPWVDLEGTSESLSTRAETDFLTRDMIRTWSALYRNGEDPRHPLVSPIHGDLTGLPPLLVQVGGAEILRDEGEALVARAVDAGVDARLELFPELPHVWHLLPGLDEAARAIRQLADFVRAHTEPPAAVAASAG